MTRTSTFNSSVDCFQVSLQFEDIDVLDKFAHRDLLNIDGPAAISLGSKKHGSLRSRPTCRLSLYNKHFAAMLVQLGCIPNKCNTIEFPHGIVPEKYMCDFVRGYIEADGSLVLKANGSISIQLHANCHAFLKDMKRMLIVTTGVSEPTRSYDKNNAMYLAWQSRHSVENIIDWLYHGELNESMASITMNRKYKRSQFIKSILHMPYKDRFPLIKNFKQQERKHEYDILCSLIEMTETAARNNQRYHKYKFPNSWISYLDTFALDNDGCLVSNWRDETWKRISHFR